MAEDVDVKFQPLLDDEELEDADSYTFKPQRRRSFKGWLIALVVVLIIALAGGGLYYWQQSKIVPVTYTSTAVSVGNLSTTISATGPISAHAVYALNFSNAGQISEIDVKDGQHVTQGQVLAKLYINNNTSRIAELTAPQAGTVASINGVVGASSGSGGGGGASSGSSSSAFITLIDISSLNITAQVNETDIASVKVGQPVQFTVASYPSATFRATVSSIDLVGQTSSSVVTFPVHLTVDQSSLSGNNLYPGMTATVSITTAQRIGVLLVPAAAISFTTTALQAGEVSRSAITALTSGSTTSSTSSTSTSSTRVVLTLVNGKLTPVLITTGLNSGQFVEVLSGLQQGDAVVVSQTGGNISTTTTTRTSSGGGFGGGGFGGGGGGGGFGGGGGRTGSGG